MRVVFFGSPEFAVPSLKALCAEHEVVAVVCQPDRERDRKGRIVHGALKLAATALNLPVYQFESVKKEGVELLRELRPDVMVTCAYGQILSKEILDIAPYGVINVHGSLLPEYRGAAPVQRALMDGKRVTGITIMKTDVGMDSGDILAVEEIEISDNDYIDELFGKLSLLGADLLVKTLNDYALGKITPIKQDESKVTYAPMIRKDEANIDFTQDATVIRNKVRGVGYGAFLYYGMPMKVFRLDVVSGNGAPGEIIESLKNKLVVACGKDALCLTEMQMSGKKRMKISDFLNGVRVAVGEVLTPIGE